MAKKAQMIPPDSYPQMVSRADAAGISRILRSTVTAVKATYAMEEKGDSLRDAVRGYVGELETTQDRQRQSDLAHEIRGLAETAGLLAAGRIADGLCRYFEESERLGLAADDSVVALHVSAIGRAARTQDAMSQMSDVVARELAILSDRKLREIAGRRGTPGT